MNEDIRNMELIEENKLIENYHTLNLRNKKIKKLMKPSQLEAGAIELFLDENELQRLDNIENYTNLQKLSVSTNHLVRMYGVCRLVHLTFLNLSQNNILSIEGLKELVYLKYLNISRNNIRTIDHLRSNFHLEHLDLSDNSITYITDISYLRELKELLLHGNKISHLKMCNQYLPEGLIKLTLANNKLTDLNSISLLTHLINLEHISIANNPCVNFIDSRLAFNYRPFVLNWCANVKTIDEISVESLESLKAEWLYSQGKGRFYRIGQHEELTKYLISVCPLITEKSCENDDDRKLRFILTKAQQHQQQLKEQYNSWSGSLSNSSTEKRIINNNEVLSKTITTSSLNNSPKSCNNMVSSYIVDRNCFDNDRISFFDKYMSHSFDATMLQCYNKSDYSNRSEPAKEFNSVTKFVPVLESLISPDCRSPNKSIEQMIKGKKKNNISVGGSMRYTKTKVRPIQRCCSAQATTNVSKFSKDTKKPKIIKNDNINKQEKLQNCNLEQKTAAATLIQKIWRGYRVRSMNLLKDIHLKRCQDHLKKLTCDLEKTKENLNREQQVQKLQTQALNAIWQKIAKQPPQALQLLTSNNLDINISNVIVELTKSCNFLTSQMEKFQVSIDNLVQLISIMYKISNKEAIATQTDIIAVHTPKDEDGKKFINLKGKSMN